MSKDLDNKISKAVAWSSITEVVARFIAPIINIILARVLTPEAFGAVATITMIISFAEIFADAGFQKYLIQHQFNDANELNNATNVAFWTNFIISCILFLIICAFRNLIAVAVGSPDLGFAISVSSFNIVCVSFSSIQMARYKRDFDFKPLFYIRLISTLIPLFVTIPLAFVFKNYWALLIGTLVSNAFNAVALTWRSKWKPKFFYNFKIFKSMFSFSSITLLEAISLWITLYIDVFIVGTYLNDYYLGIYKTSMSTVNSYMNIVTAATTPVLFAALSRYQNDEKNFKKQLFTFQRLTAILVIPMGLGIFLFRDLVTSILLGSQWSEAADFIGLWGLTSAFTIILSNYNDEVYRSKGNPKVALFSQLIHILFLVAVLFATIHISFKAIYVSRALIRIQAILFSLIFMRVLYKIKITEVIKNILPQMVSAVIMLVFGVVLKLISQNTVWQLFSVFLCILFYFAILMVLFKNTRGEILAIKSINRIFQKIRVVFKKEKQ